jgi:hypothetical protein
MEKFVQITVKEFINLYNHQYPQSKVDFNKIDSASIDFIERKINGFMVKDVDLVLSTLRFNKKTSYHFDNFVNYLKSNLGLAKLKEAAINSSDYKQKVHRGKNFGIGDTVTVYTTTGKVVGFKMYGKYWRVLIEFDLGNNYKTYQWVDAVNIYTK